MLMVKRSIYRGFTIVEVLIVISVIAIMAAISIVAYNGVSKKAQNSSLMTDLREMDIAQKHYMLKNSGVALPTGEDGDISNVLVFSSNPGNTVIVRLSDDNTDYCIYGYNPKSDYPDSAQAIIKSSGSNTCSPLTPSDVDEIVGASGVKSTVTIIGNRLESFFQANGYYPRLADLKNIGLIIKPNSGNANQQQLYCRNDSIAIYLQIDQSSDTVYVYQTEPIAGISEPVNLPKLSLNNVCPLFNIRPDQPGYESTGIKSPDI